MGEQADYEMQRAITDPDESEAGERILADLTAHIYRPLLLACGMPPNEVARQELRYESTRQTALEAVTVATRKVVAASQATHTAMRERAARRKEALAAGATPAEISEAIAAGHPAGWRPQ